MIRKAKVSDAKSIVYINVFDWKKEYKNTSTCIYTYV